MDKEKEEKKALRRHTDLEVYKKAFAVAMRVFESSKSFPKEERYSLTDQIRRSSRSVCANLGKLGERGVTRLPGLANLAIVRLKLVRPRFGFSFVLNADT